ncbi:hypothetical protein AOXY_G23502 [Acipenser oxyrinchus oxyrinchus]|uniref:Uncharacterized protein n=1 Tax=Acipenser oxyrinchus oxyrinchus TaxID=40147 RepID=A0AAD8CXG6_ACIOX|nr:hypothetical protein AOXY_G23502 [Acipenser oxyrinchus oxyrinchus]
MRWKKTSKEIKGKVSKIEAAGQREKNQNDERRGSPSPLGIGYDPDESRALKLKSEKQEATGVLIWNFK